MKTRRLVIDAIRQSDMTMLEKLRTRMLLAFFPGAMDAVCEYVDEGTRTVNGVSAIGDGEIIKFILEHLPEIMALIEFIVSLFKSKP